MVTVLPIGKDTELGLQVYLTFAFVWGHLANRYVSVALSVGSPLLGVTQHPARWSSDFPPA